MKEVKSETRFEASSVRTDAENMLRIHYNKHEGLIANSLSSKQMNELIDQSQEIDSVTQYVDHMVGIRDQVSVLAIRKRLVDYYKEFEQALSADLPPAAFDRQLEDLIRPDQPLRHAQQGEVLLRKALDAITQPTREQLERQRREQQALHEAEQRGRFQDILQTYLRDIGRLQAKIEQAQKSALPPKEKHDYVTDRQREVDSIERKLSLFRNDEPRLFDEVRQALEATMNAA